MVSLSNMRSRSQITESSEAIAGSISNSDPRLIAIALQSSAFLSIKSGYPQRRFGYDYEKLGWDFHVVLLFKNQRSA